MQSRAPVSSIQRAGAVRSRVRRTESPVSHKSRNPWYKRECEPNDITIPKWHRHAPESLSAGN